MPFIATTSSSSAWLQLKVCSPPLSLSLFTLLPQPCFNQLSVNSLAKFAAFAVRSPHSHSWSAHNMLNTPPPTPRPSALSLPAAANAIIILTTLVLCLSEGECEREPPSTPPPPAAGRARRALLHLVLLSQRFVWPFSLSIFSFYLLLIFLPLLIQLLLFLACILLISRRAQSKGREKCAVKTCGEKGEMKMKI